MYGSQDEIPPPPPPSTLQTPTTQQTPHTVLTIKLPILKKGEYDIWAMKMEHYLAHTDYPIWEVIQNGNEGLHKGYDRFQSLMSQLEIHGAGISTKDANQKFLKSLPSAWLYCIILYSVSNPSGQNSQCEKTSSYSLLANQSSFPQLDHEDLEQLDEYDLEEMDLK
ncbi:hypothetical protein Tco_1423564 [Tanacetum coccineum]